MPDVDFDSEMIIVSSRGKVAKIYADRTQGILRVIAGEITHADPSLKTTDPFHIIKTERVEFQSIVFDHHPITDEEMSATEDIQTQDFGVQAAVPTCVNFYQWRTGQYANAVVQNLCRYTVRLRMIWAWSGDGQCQELPYLKAHTETRGAANIPPHPYVSELRSC